MLFDRALVAMRADNIRVRAYRDAWPTRVFVIYVPNQRYHSDGRPHSRPRLLHHTVPMDDVPYLATIAEDGTMVGYYSPSPNDLVRDDWKITQTSRATRHAAIRLKERVGIPKRAAERHIERVLAEGTPLADCPPPLRNYQDSIEPPATRGIAYQGHVYFFAPNDILITVFAPKHLEGDLSRITTGGLTS